MKKQTIKISKEKLKGYDKKFLLGLYERMFLIREFEERVKFLFLQGSMPGTIHQCQGQEATAVGVCSALNLDDFITSTHRPHGHALAKGLSPEEMMIELFGKGTGCCKGKGGSMHVGNMKKGMPPAIAIVGGGTPLAAGMALSFKMKKTKQVVACFFGDGATSEGAFHESITLAAIWNLPVIFVCENNLYGASTRVDKITRLKHIADRAKGYGIRGERLDGNDVIAVHEATKKAVEECRSGNGPVLLELETYRITGHSRRDPCLYQPKEEREKWFAREPIKSFEELLVKHSEITIKEIEKTKSAVEEQVSNAIKVAEKEPEPTVDDLTTHVYV